MKKNTIIKLGLVAVVLVVVNLITLGFVITQTASQRKMTQLAVAEMTNSINENVMQDDNLRIIADTDQGKITDAPMVAMVGHQVLINSSQDNPKLILEIIGNNGYAIYPSRVKNGFAWNPQRTGIFQVNLLDQDGTKLCSRRINVSDIEGGSAYQLGDLISKTDKAGNVTFSTSIFSVPKNTEGNLPRPVTAFTIGEGGIWKKQIRDYSSDQISITEGKDFVLDRGTYSVRAAIRDQFSVEDEDYKNITYKKESKDGHHVTIDKIEHSVINNENETTSDRFEVKAHCSKGCKLVYAFFVNDSISEKRTTDGLNGYQEENVFTCPTVKWKYSFTARVKHEENAGVNEIENEENNGKSKPIKLPNAYEDVKTVNIEGVQPYEKLEIKKIEIEPFIIEDYYKNEKTIKQVITSEQQTAKVYAHNNNYITVYLKDEGDYEYSANVVDDGESIPLEEVMTPSVTNAKTFVYYPKSGGSKEKVANPNETHRLTITVRKLDNVGYVQGEAVRSLDLKIDG